MNGKEESIEMLYTLLKHRKSDARDIVRDFFGKASNELRINNVEKILRHILIDEAMIEKDGDIVSLIDDCKKRFDKGTFEKYPDLETRINKIQEEALNPKEVVTPKEGTFVITTIDTGAKTNGSDYIEKTGDKTGDKAASDRKALREISESVLPDEKSEGNEMLRFFLRKAKGLAERIGRFFEGGDDDHDNR